MVSWLKLVWMRAKVTQLVESSLRRSLDLMGSEGPTFNALTRGVRDRGGNAYDAAALYMVQLLSKTPADQASEAYFVLSRFVVTHYHDMVYPHVVEEAVLKAATMLPDGD